MKIYMKIGYVLLLVGLISCSKEVEVPQSTLAKTSQVKTVVKIPEHLPTSAVQENPFVGPVGSLVTMQYPRDRNGYYLVPLDTTTGYARYNVYVEATKVIPKYRYNGVMAIQATFDCDSYWLIMNSLAVTIPLYSAFGLSSSPYYRQPLSVKNKTVILSQYKNTMVPLVQATSIYLKDYFDGNLTQPADEYKPTDPNTRAWSKRIIGPIPKYFKGDTIKVYCKVSWDVGQYSIDHPDLTEKLDSIRIIFK